MKFALKLIVFAILSFSIGIACASPLLVSELNIRPWITYVQGPTAEMTVEVVYANFTLQNEGNAITKDSGPTISYYAVINVTNPSDFEATVSRVDFMAAQQIINNSANPHPYNGGEGWSAKGAWVDGKWYNLTWVTVGYPSTNENGSLYWVSMPSGQEYWMEGVQIYDRYINGTLAATYLNMNGTWTDVIGRITVERQQQGSNYLAHGLVANEMHIFENMATREYPSNGTVYDQFYGATRMVYHLVGNDSLFDNVWVPHKSRLFLISGNWDMREHFADSDLVAKLQSGNLTFKTMASNIIDSEFGFSNNTVTNTWSDTTELKQVQLTQSGNSFIYNPLFINSKAFQVDKWGVEVNLRNDAP